MSDPSEPTFSQRIPDGEDRLRAVCDRCGWIHYENPKVVVGSVCTWESKILLCRRAIEPRSGFWTLPAGYLEQNETTEEGAMREAQEEACADIQLHALLAIYNIARISQVQLMYKGVLASPDIAVGLESTDVGLFRWDQIPWADLAFPSVYWALNHFQLVRETDVFVPFENPQDTSQFEGVDPFADFTR